MSTQASSNGNGSKNGTPNADNRPIVQLRKGMLTLSIWENEGEYGPMHNGRLQRSYRDNEGAWQNTSSIQASDFLDAMKLMDQADTWSERRKAAVKAERKQADGAGFEQHDQAPPARSQNTGVSRNGGNGNSKPASGGNFAGFPVKLAGGTTIHVANEDEARDLQAEQEALRDYAEAQAQAGQRAASQRRAA